MPRSFTLAWPVITTMGTESIFAVRMPVMVLVAPGPEVTRTTPGSPARRGQSRPPCAWRPARGASGPAGWESRPGRRTAGWPRRRETEDVLHPLLLQYVHHCLGAREGALRLCISHVSNPLSSPVPRASKYLPGRAKNKHIRVDSPRAKRYDGRTYELVQGMAVRGSPEDPGPPLPNREDRRCRGDRVWALGPSAHRHLRRGGPHLLRPPGAGRHGAAGHAEDHRFFRRHGRLAGGSEKPSQPPDAAGAPRASPSPPSRTLSARRSPSRTT